MRSGARSRSASARRSCATSASATWCSCRTRRPRATWALRRSGCASSATARSDETMAGRGQEPSDAAPRTGAAGARVLLIEAPYYVAVAAELAAGAIAELEAAGVAFERVAVPGAMEIPLALAQAVQAGLIPGDAARARFDGCVALGCVIRGDTSHYDIVCANANTWLMELA